jgi:hypothetical protein
MDANLAILRAARHEVGHSFTKFLLDGRPGGIELKWTRPGEGSCQIRWSRDLNHYDDVLFNTYSALIDAGGLAAERLFDVYADPRWSVTDREHVLTACRELVGLVELKDAYGPSQMADGTHGIAQHLLRPYTDLIDELARKAATRELWLGTDIHDNILMLEPSLRGFDGYFNQPDWRLSWKAILDSFNSAQYDRVDSHQALAEKWDQRYGRSWR